MNAADMPLPPYRHIPGKTARLDEAFFAPIKAEMPAVTLCATSVDNQAWLYGIRLFNAGFYWEAHEVLEPVWLKAMPNSRERHLVRAVIHLANGMLKDAMGLTKARQRLVGMCCHTLAEAFPEGCGRLMGIDAEAVLTAAAELAAGNAQIRLSAHDAI